MADGQLNNINVAFIIQARMKSTRLPGKILLPLPFNTGKPIIQWIVDEVKLSSYAGEVIVATSKNIENDILFNYCAQSAIKCYRGDEENVLSRFIEIVKQHTFDVVVRLTSDNPLLDISFLDEAITYHVKNDNDYTRTEDLPLGMNFEIISPAALWALDDLTTSDYDKEHVTPYIKNDHRFKKATFKMDVSRYLKDIRLTIDYPVDYLLLSAVLSTSISKQLKGIRLVEKIHAAFPWFFQINQTNIQKQKYASLNEELKAAGALLEGFDLKDAAQILKSYEA